jgi:hypothetical protein
VVAEQVAAVAELFTLQIRTTGQLEMFVFTLKAITLLWRS